MTPWLPLNQAIDRAETNLSIFWTPQTLHISSRSRIFVSNSHSKMRFVTFLGQDQEDCGSLQHWPPLCHQIWSRGSNQLISALKQNMGCRLGKGIPGPSVPPWNKQAPINANLNYIKHFNFTKYFKCHSKNYYSLFDLCLCFEIFNVQRTCPDYWWFSKP